MVSMMPSQQHTKPVTVSINLSEQAHKAPAGHVGTEHIHRVIHTHTSRTAMHSSPINPATHSPDCCNLLLIKVLPSAMPNLAGH